jgi:hypothetical protein
MIKTRRTRLAEHVTRMKGEEEEEEKEEDEEEKDEEEEEEKEEEDEEKKKNVYRFSWESQRERDQ